MVTVKGGLKNTLGVFDKFTAEYTKAVSKKSQSTYSLELDFPYLDNNEENPKDLSFSYAYKQAVIDKQINEGIK